MKQELTIWGDLLCLIVQNKDEAQAYALHVGKMHKPQPVTLGDGSADVECLRCAKSWPCELIEDLQAWVEII